MLKKLILENWKSFRYAELYFDPLTVLIGTNASGKSNVVEALEFLRRMATGETVDVALNGDRALPPIRGGSEWSSFKQESQFILRILVEDENDKNQEYLYSLKTNLSQKLPKISQEDIQWNYVNNVFRNQTLCSSNDLEDKVKLAENTFTIVQRDKIDEVTFDQVMMHSVFKNQNISDLFDFKDFHEQILKSKTIEFKRKILENLQEIFIINPFPSNMRIFSKLSENLEQDASNIAGVLVALPNEQKAEIESTLSHYLEHFPEGDIKKIWAEKVGRLGIDAMLYCQEEWQPGQITEIDARSMSDGTLRFIGILTALLTRPEGSLIVIEEIDNGLHPSRAELLVRTLREIGTKRKIDLLITTHNPALLDALGPEIVPFVVVAHRDSETGESKLTQLEDIENLPKLLASGTLGKLATKGSIEKSLAESI
jgi:predicted ATPase